MSQALIEQYTTEADGLKAYVARTLEGVEGRDLNEAELRTVTDAKQRIEQLNGQIEPLAAFEATKVSHQDLTRMENRSLATRRDTSSEVETRSMGQSFINSDVFNNYPGRGTSSRMTFEARALPSSLTTMAAGLPPKQRIDLSAAPYPTPLLDLIDTIPVSGNGVETIVWALTGAAGIVLEGAAKPSAELLPTVTSFTLDTIAVWTQATRQLLEDSPAIAAKIDTELARAVTKKMETEAAAALVAATIPTATNATSLTNAIRAGVGVVQAAGYDPNAVLLNPADWARLDINVFGSTLLGPQMQSSFWGLQPVAANSQPAGTATVGDFSAGVQRYARNGVSLYVTDSDQDDFIKNLFKILAETRCKTVVTRPAALCEVSSAGAFSVDEGVENPAAAAATRGAAKR
jgi:HK97 family phage major capsid protein